MKVEHWERQRPVCPWLPASTDRHYIKELAGKRISRPVLTDEDCNLCSVCWVGCPEGAIKRGLNGIMIDLEDCRGCGICAVECARGVIAMREEQE